MKQLGIWLVFGGVWLLLLAMTLWHGGRTPIFMLLVVTFLAMQGAAAKWTGPRFVQIVRTYSQPELYAGGSVQIRLSIKLLGGLPPLWLRVREHFGGFEHPEMLLFAGFRREITCSYTIDRLPRGIYGQKEERVSARHTDWFGWFSYVVPCEAEGILLVQPRPLAGYGEEEIESGAMEPADGASNGFALSGAPAFGLRSYEPGDPLRAISWKASARRGDLTVRSFEEESTAAKLILLDTNPEAYQRWRNESHAGAAAGPGTDGSEPEHEIAVFERAVSVAAALLEAAEAEGWPALFRHGGMSVPCLWQRRGGGGAGPLLLAAVACASGSAAGPDLIYDAAKVSPKRPITLITGVISPSLAAAASELKSAGVPLQLVSCMEPEPTAVRQADTAEQGGETYASA